jgi:hypothetical protein
MVSKDHGFYSQSGKTIKFIFTTSLLRMNNEGARTKTLLYLVGIMCQTGARVMCQTGAIVICQTGAIVICQTGARVMCQTGARVMCQTGAIVICQSGDIFISFT